MKNEDSVIICLSRVFMSGPVYVAEMLCLIVYFLVGPDLLVIIPAKR